jgi:hypothetical protein
LEQRSEKEKEELSVKRVKRPKKYSSLPLFPSVLIKLKEEKQVNMRVFFSLI